MIYIFKRQSDLAVYRKDYRQGTKMKHGNHRRSSESHGLVCLRGKQKEGDNQNYVDIIQ